MLRTIQQSYATEDKLLEDEDDKSVEMNPKFDESKH